MMPRTMRRPHLLRPGVLALASLTTLLTACSDPAATGSAPAEQGLDAAQIFAVVYHCKDGTVFTTYPRGESAQYASGTAAPQSPTAITDCEGTEARTPAEAEQLRRKARPAAQP